MCKFGSRHIPYSLSYPPYKNTVLVARHNSQYSAKILINYDIIYVIIYSYINNHVIRIIPTTTTTYGSQEIQYKDRRRRGQHWCKDGGLELLETASTRRNESKNNKNKDNNNIKTGMAPASTTLVRSDPDPRKYSI